MVAARRLLICSLPAWLVLTSSSAVIPPPAQDIEIRIGSRRHEVDGRDRRGTTYYELKDLAGVLDLKMREQDDRVVLTGPRGILELVADRPLVRIHQEYLLLSAPAWRRGNRDWWVPADFLSRALPSILDRRLEPLPNGDLSVRAAQPERISVEVINYPDHVSFLFPADETAPVQVRETGEGVEVRLSGRDVEAEVVGDEPDSRFVSHVEITRGIGEARLTILKGTRFDGFRQYTLRNPGRTVVEVFGRRLGPIVPREDRGRRPPARAVPADRRPEPPVSRSDPSRPAPDRPDLVVLDPGHGGTDVGAQVEELSEKTVVFDLGQSLMRELLSLGREVRLTRNRDVELGIVQRSAAGNYYKPDVYVSLHVGAAPAPETGGPVVYFHRYLEVEEPLAGEDSGREAAPVALDSAAGSDGPKTVADPLRLIPWEEGQREFLAESRRLAYLIQKELNDLFGTDNSALEVPLSVLAPVRAPAVLIETGFLTHPEDRQRLSESEFRIRISEAIIRALERFFL